MRGSAADTSVLCWSLRTAKERALLKAEYSLTLGRELSEDQGVGNHIVDSMTGETLSIDGFYEVRKLTRGPRSCPEGLACR